MADHYVTDGPGELVVVKGQDGRIFGPYLTREEAETLWNDCYPEGEWEILGLYTLTPEWVWEGGQQHYDQWERTWRAVDPWIEGGSSLTSDETVQRYRRELRNEWLEKART